MAGSGNTTPPVGRPSSTPTPPQVSQSYLALFCQLQNWLMQERLWFHVVISYFC